MAHIPASAPTPACPALAVAPATEFYKSKALRVVAGLAVLTLAIAMIVWSCSGPGRVGVVGSTPGQGPAQGGQVTYSVESPIYFGPSKRLDLDLKPDEWSPVIITPARCKSATWVVNPPVGYFIQFPDGKEIEVTPTGAQGFLPTTRGRGEYRFRGVQPGQKLVMYVTY